jgi:Nucleotidyl transferase AbiEii toxin, Type IV TA system
MPIDYLHNHPQFADLIRIVAQEKGIDPALVEKDYWIMHSLYGLQQLGLKFELKGGTSLSKGHQIINRFSAAEGQTLATFNGTQISYIDR